MELLIATKNIGKQKFIEEVLSGSVIKTRSLADLGVEDEFEETGTTLAANARGKAKFYHQLTKMACLADDTGFFVDDLPGQLGVEVKRWWQTQGRTSSERMAEFTRRVDQARGSRRAEFRTAACLVWGERENETKCFEGVAAGRIAENVGADIDDDVPFASVFIPDGFDEVVAKLLADGKKEFHHRYRAIAKARDFLMAHRQIFSSK